MICHFLIGVPGSGKSTFAHKLAQLANYRIVSTDAIREKLYGDASIQGVWGEIEAQLMSEIVQATASGHSVIYDATNAKRAWRMELLGRLNSLADSPLWMGWYLQTPLQICKLWNQKRSRQVPEVVIENMYKSLQNFPPVTAEGFTTVTTIDLSSPKFDFFQIRRQIALLPRRIVKGPSHNGNITLHSYSSLQDFERLIYLIALIVRYPGIGNLQSTYPIVLENILGRVPYFTSALAEITACIGKLYGNIYAQPEAIASDLHWLQENFFIHINNVPDFPSLPISLPAPVTSGSVATHPYSDFPTFQRLMQIIRFILHHPFLHNWGQASLTSFVSALKKDDIINDKDLDSVRQDIDNVLKPYGILPNFSIRESYFAGTGILSQYEFMRLFKLFQSQAQISNDPIAWEICKTFTTRIEQTKLAVNQVYPAEGITKSGVINSDYLPSDALAKNLPQLEQAIGNRQLLELARFAGSGKFNLDEGGFFLAFPLEIIFSNTSWYLGYECESGKYAGLFRFERLDRLFLGQHQEKSRTIAEQKNSLEKLQKLATASAGLFLGNSTSDQHQFLSDGLQEDSPVCVAVELWFNNNIYRFISEGTKKFYPKQIKMSPPLQKGKLSLQKSIFCLNKTKDEYFPNCLRVLLPKWSLNDVEFIRWIVGFGGNLKVVQPPELVDKVKGMGKAIFEIYE
ncbi:WYL domain-containing protein [Umezakia ovalisporum]|jgi:predicted kinase|uniref:WYL domain-containing protein n=2 Tax=Umezakia ovalisporum TaxID=75695 RepID=A0AA43GWJ4_9CYAN|nr:WYL domain-containing protein [Umezakia ovalisporum]MBI1243178.1 WYL domain-containing protein [Nostoc sp. RI_552]MDH6055498.1 WYL domain-containing protein [Umezakia ovalisporum FSS-43]MDH6062570.1 WYL domain-containing protein [Umezakia ovalisporum FSS-62]MDH6070502.1 WYL domain-containing protein [Umezakia ovalisporum CobakiLakeA]MDH6083178.1 WYL domain-containing protein [Umezakia ovalisporum FSS-44]